MSQNSINKAITFLSLFRSIHPDFPLPLMFVFLEIAKSGKRGLSVSQVMERTGISQSASSRHTRILTTQSVRGRKGYDLCDWFDDKADRRVRVFRLNKKGEALYEAIKGTLD